MIKLHIPLPPSVNMLYPGNGKRRWKSKGYKAWLKEAEIMLNQQYKRPCITVPVQITYRMGRPSNRRMDIANREKACSDLLVKQHIIEDDSLISRITMEWADITGVDVEILPL